MRRSAARARSAWRPGIASLLLSFLALTPSPCAAAEPTYRGRTAVQWAELVRSGSDEEASQASSSLTRLGPDAADAIPILMDVLRTGSSSRVFDASFVFELLRAAGAPATADLIAILEDPKTEFFRRSAAAKALGLIGAGAKAAVPVLGKLLGSEKSRLLRVEAAEALGRIGLAAAEAVPGLRTALEAKDADLSLAATIALGRIGVAASSAVEVLQSRLVGGTLETRAAAAVSLLGITGRVGAGAAVFEEVLGGSDEDVRFEVLLAAEDMGPRAEPLVPILARHLKARDVKARRDVAGTLRQLGVVGVGAMSALIEALDDPDDAMVRGFSAVALGLMGSRAVAALPRLSKLLPSRTGRERVMFAMGIVGITGKGESHVALFTQGLLEQESKGWALEALSWTGPAGAAALPHLRAIAADDSEAYWERARAREAIRRIQGK